MQSVLKVSALKLGKEAHVHVQLHEEKEVALSLNPKGPGVEWPFFWQRLQDSGGCGWHQSHMAEQRPFLQNAASQHSPNQVPSASHSSLPFLCCRT